MTPCPCWQGDQESRAVGWSPASCLLTPPWRPRWYEGAISRVAHVVDEAAGPFSTVEPGRGAVFQAIYFIAARTSGPCTPVSGSTRAEGSAPRIAWKAADALADSRAF